jgi:hypothetical protein
LLSRSRDFVFWKTTGNSGIPGSIKSEESKNENARFSFQKRAFFMIGVFA